MLIVHLIEWFFGGAFLANSVPHIVNGISGRPFQSPFAKPPGQGLSSSMVNVLWGFFNLVLAYVLLVWLGHFNIHYWWQVVTTFVGALLLSVMMARHFGRFHGGDLKK
jgi:hypothetical protein